MNLRKYIPFVGGVLLFLVALVASQLSGKLAPQEAKATESPECEQNTNGYCIEFYFENGANGTIAHQHDQMPANKVDFFHGESVVYHWPFDLLYPSSGPDPSVAPKYVTEADMVVEMRKNEEGAPWVEELQVNSSLDLPSEGFHQKEVTMTQQGDDHSYVGYQMRAYIKVKYSDNSTESLPTSAAATVNHHKHECNDGIDNDALGVGSLGTDFNPPPFSDGSPGIADPHCIDEWDNSESWFVDCSNGEDDGDIDTDIDMADSECYSWADESEYLGS